MSEHLLSIILFTPLAGMVILLMLPSNRKNLIRIWANIAALAGFACLAAAGVPVRQEHCRIPDGGECGLDSIAGRQVLHRDRRHQPAFVDADNAAGFPGDPVFMERRGPPPESLLRHVPVAADRE